jgi:hypothetical protein
MLSKSDRIRCLNDHLRTTFAGGLVLVSASLAEGDKDLRARVFHAVREFSEFDPDNDPYHEHDLGFFDVEGERYFFKVDYYDRDAKYQSADPADPACTCRVLTIGHHSDY